MKKISEADQGFEYQGNSKIRNAVRNLQGILDREVSGQSLDSTRSIVGCLPDL